MLSSPGTRYTLSPIAETNARFSDFAPYVPSINDHGVVAFQATLKSAGEHGNAGSGVFTGEGGAIAAATDPVHGPFADVCSHPDLNEHGALSFYATLRSGQRGVFLVRGGDVTSLADSFGPLGPTINAAGAVAFRANAKANANAEGSAIFAGDPERTIMIAETGPFFTAFHGLPVIRRGGSVLFRADRSSGGEGIYLGDGTQTIAVVETGEVFRTLGSFPSVNDAGVVAFCATLQTGNSGVFLAADGRIETIVDLSSGFESFRGVLINNAGPVMFLATPAGGSLGVFTGPHPIRDRLLAIGSPLFDSTIAEFALNPVSVNDAGQLAIRVRLTDQRQFIVRADRAA
jgi:hypothetical protein